MERGRMPYLRTSGGRCLREGGPVRYGRAMRFQETADGGTGFAVRVVPRARKDAIQGEIGDALKVRLCAPPVDGAANAALVAFLAEKAGIPRSRVRIVAGATARDKRVVLDGIAPGDAASRLLGG